MSIAKELMLMNNNFKIGDMVCLKGGFGFFEVTNLTKYDEVLSVTISKKFNRLAQPLFKKDIMNVSADMIVPADIVINKEVEKYNKLINDLKSMKL